MAIYTKAKDCRPLGQPLQPSIITHSEGHIHLVDLGALPLRTPEPRFSKGVLLARAKGLCSLEWDTHTRSSEGYSLARNKMSLSLGIRCLFRASRLLPEQREKEGLGRRERDGYRPSLQNTLINGNLSQG